MAEGSEKPIGQKASCGCCCYWVKVRDRSTEGYQSEGVCRRRAPIAIPSPHVLDDGTDAAGETGLLTAWPRTFDESDWCGEYVCTADLRGIDRLKRERE
jgi:hypothetical protein